MIKQRLRLRPLSSNDIDDYYLMVKDKHVANAAGFPAAKNKIKAITMLKHDINYAKSYAIVLAKEEKMIGLISLYEWMDENQAPSPYARIVGYMLNPAYQNHGYMEEGLSILIRKLQRESTIKMLYAEVAEDNLPSIHVLTNNHFQNYHQFLNLNQDHMDLIYQLRL